jgi:hypothetical protein
LSLAKKNRRNSDDADESHNGEQKHTVRNTQMRKQGQVVNPEANEYAAITACQGLNKPQSED